MLGHHLLLLRHHLHRHCHHHYHLHYRHLVHYYRQNHYHYHFHYRHQPDKMYIVPATPLASPSETYVHKRFMRAALDMADTALRTDEVPVGCVFVYRNRIIGRGMNDTNRSLCVCPPPELCLFCYLRLSR